MKYYRTIRHLKPIQIRYRIYYALRSRLRRITGFSYPLSIQAQGMVIPMAPSIAFPIAWLGGNRFKFLNLEQDFGSAIDWNYPKYGKLWAYNLNYFDYLNQAGMNKDEGLRLTRNFMSRLEQNHEGMEPFPISLRVVNWIKFICQHKIRDSHIDSSLYAQFRVLQDNLEYHIMGNHLLENGFALLFGAVYFEDGEFLKDATKILRTELEEQILSDGAHFELSPMYHQIMLFRVLDCINLLTSGQRQEEDYQITGKTELKNSESISKKQSLTYVTNEKKRIKPGDILPLLRNKASLMSGWLEQMTYSNGDVPLFNDSAPGISFTTQELIDYARRLGVEPKVTPLGESGYRAFRKDRYELIIDAGPLGPDYIPGHGHCDMLNFELRVDGEPCIVDTGTSTYEPGSRRQLERSTSAHNTVCVSDLEQSEIWGAFRVGKRARINVLDENNAGLVAGHNGFKIRHRRYFHVEPEVITIRDELLPGGNGSARFHFVPGCQVRLDGDTIGAGGLLIHLKNASEIWTEPYDFALGFNKRAEGQCLCVAFKDELQTRLTVREQNV